MLKRQATVGRAFPIFVGGKPVTTATTLKVFDKYTKQVRHTAISMHLLLLSPIINLLESVQVGYEVSLAGPQEIENALQLAHQAAPAMRVAPSPQGFVLFTLLLFYLFVCSFY